MNNKTNTNIWKEQLKEKNLLRNIQEDVNQQFDELLSSGYKFLDELDHFRKKMESLYEIRKSFTYEDLKLGSFTDSRITDEEKILLRSLPYQWFVKEGNDIGWYVDQTQKIKTNLNTHYQVFLQDNKLSGKYGWDFTEKGTNN